MTNRSSLRRRCRPLFLVALAWTAMAAAAQAQTPDMDACGQAAGGAARVQACTNIIGAPGNPPALSAWAYANRCQAQENARQYDAAIADCSESLRLDSNGANVYNLRGFAYYAKGDSERALADYDTALRLNPDNAYAHSARGNIYLERGSYQQAIQEFDAALKLNATDAWAMAGRGYAYSRLGDDAHGLQDLQAAVTLDPHAYLARLRLAELLAMQGEGDQVRSLDQETLRLFPKQAQAIYRERCFHLAILGDTTPALADCNRALQLKAKDAVALGYRGYAHLRAGQSDAAIADYSAAIALSSKDAPSFFGRSAAHAAQAEIPAASRDIAAARAIDPKIDARMTRLHVSAPPGLRNAANAGSDAASAESGASAPLSGSSGDSTATDATAGAAGSEDRSVCSGKTQAALEAEIAACTRLLQADPAPDAQAWAYSRRGTAYTDQRDFDHAIQDYSAAIEASPRLAYAYSGRGLAYYYKGDFARAIADQDNALRLDPTFSGAYGARGYAHLKAGDSAAAHNDFDSALKGHPDQALWLFGRATAFAALGQQAEALNDMTNAQKLDPSIDKTVLDIFDYRAPAP